MKKVKKFIGLIFIIGGLVCMFFAYQYFAQYQDALEEYDDLITKNTSEGKGFDGFHIDWKALKKENPDIVGWIRMSPDVNYPIVQGKDNSYYLHRGFKKTYNINGSIFMHADNNKDWSDRNTVVYGHNMNNGSMFGNNDYYKDASYTKKHPCFKIFTEDGRYKYRIFATMIVHDATAPYQVSFKDDQEFGKYLKEMSKLKLYSTDVKVSTDDFVVTLSTCTNFGKERFIIQGKMESFMNNSGYEMTIDEIKEKKKEEIIKQQLLYEAEQAKDKEADTSSLEDPDTSEGTNGTETEEVPEQDTSQQPADQSDNVLPDANVSEVEEIPQY